MCRNTELQPEDTGALVWETERMGQRNRTGKWGGQYGEKGMEDRLINNANNIGEIHREMHYV